MKYAKNDRRALAMRTRWILAGILIFVVVAVGFSQFGDPYGLKSKGRKAWKAHALVDIRQWSDDPNWITNEIAAVKKKSGEEELSWLSSHLITMKNGEWIAYSAVCSKEQPRIHDIFLGRGSNGRFYYSTFHFCIGMCSLAVLGADQPTNLLSFADSYFLREFDGQSDECLNSTWPIKQK